MEDIEWGGMRWGVEYVWVGNREEKLVTVGEAT